MKSLTFSKRLEERSYLLPKRVALAFAVIEVIATEENPTASQIMEATDYSRAYVSACLTGFKRYGIVLSTRGARGGYKLVKESDETTVGEVLEAISKAEDRSIITTALYRFLIGAAQKLTIEDLLNGIDGNDF